MKKLALVYALLLAASPAAAQLATSQRVQRLNGQSVQSTPTVAPTTGVFCIEEMTATFCNVVTGPNTSGYGSRSVSTSSSRAASSGVSASRGALAASVCPFRHAGANLHSTNSATDQTVDGPFADVSRAGRRSVAARRPGSFSQIRELTIEAEQEENLAKFETCRKRGCLLCCTKGLGRMGLPNA